MTNVYYTHTHIMIYNLYNYIQDEYFVDRNSTLDTFYSYHYTSELS